MLVREVIERARNVFLNPGGDDADAFDILASPISTTAPTTMTLQGLQEFTPQSVVEFDDDSMELALTKEAEATTAVDLDERGFLETTAATHAAGIKVWIDRTYPTITIFNAVKALIQSLYGMGLYAWALDSSNTFRPTGLITLPASAKRVLRVVADLSSDELSELREDRDYDVFNIFTPKKVKVHSGAVTGRTLHIAYAKDFDLTGLAPSTDLSTVGVPESLQPHLALGATGMLLQGKEPPRAIIETIRNQLGAETVPVGSALQIASTLLRTFEQVHVRREVEKLDDEFPPRVRYG